eukprot:3993693-Alexandrium_andersonii.AAC.1
MDPPLGTPFGTFRRAPSVVRVGISVNGGAERTPRELRGSSSRYLPGSGQFKSRMLVAVLHGWHVKLRACTTWRNAGRCS